MDNILQPFLKISEKEGITLTALEKKLGASKGVLSRAVANNTDIQGKWLKKLVENYPQYNIEWLLNGKGEMLKKDSRQYDYNANDINLTSVNKTHSNYNKGIPLINTDAFAGNGNIPVSIKDQDILARYVVPEFRNADFMISVKGSSMYPKYNSGDIIACKTIKDPTFFQWGRVYVIHHRDQGTFVKRLFKGKNSLVECRSDNPSYEPFEIDPKEVTDWALVIGVIRLEG